MKALFGDKSFFDYTKPTKLISNLLKSVHSEDSIVLDIFAGSGSTAHSVFGLNSKIMVIENLFVFNFQN